LPLLNVSAIPTTCPELLIPLALLLVPPNVPMSVTTVPFQITACEATLPDVGFLTLRDAETDELLELDTRNPRVRALFAKAADERERTLTERLRRANVDRLAIRTDQPYAQSLQKFFRARERQR
jgi:uncharacterized protein (DUF58 family)